MSTKQQHKPKRQPAKSTTSVAKKSNSKNILLVLSAIVVITSIAYIPALKSGFTNWDDNVYIPENPLIKSLKANNIKKMFDTEHHISLNYHPITILSLAIDYNRSGYNPKTFHFTNLLFHLLNTCLVFWFVFILSEKKLIVAGITAILFAIHPMHVESVAWISERKDVLYVFFFMAALIVYLKYIDLKGLKKTIYYILVLLLFLLSVLSKAMGIVLPFILLLIDYYKDRKFNKNIIIEKLPFLLLSVYFGLLAVKIQSNGAIAGFATFSVFQRICFASYGIVMYMYKLFLPIHLTCFYPYPSLNNNHMPIVFYIAPFIVLSFMIGVIYLIRKNKAIVFGFLFFIITVAMVLQFISVGKAIIAERYTYLSYTGLFFILAMEYNELQKSTAAKLEKYKKIATIALAVLIVFFFYSTFERAKVWTNSEALWTDAIEEHPNDETAYTNRGSYLINKKGFDVDKKDVGAIEYDKALADFNISIKINPTAPKVFTNRANIYGTKGQFDLSLKDYSKAIELNPTDAEVYANRGVTYSIMGQFTKAIEDYNKSLSMRNVTITKRNRAFAYVSSGQYQKGVDELNELIKEDPAFMDYYIYRGVAYFNLNNYAAALADNTKAIEIDPTYNRSYYNRSATYKKMGNYQAAYADALKAKSLGYAVEDSYLNELKK